MQACFSGARETESRETLVVDINGHIAVVGNHCLERVLSGQRRSGGAGEGVDEEVRREALAMER